MIEMEVTTCFNIWILATTFYLRKCVSLTQECKTKTNAIKPFYNNEFTSLTH